VGGAPAPVDSTASDVWVSTALGLAAVPGRDGRQSQGGLPRAEAAGVGCAPTRVSTPRPRVQGGVSRASRSNERGAMDGTPIPGGQDGWALSRR
jgi:hypothetical protein